MNIQQKRMLNAFMTSAETRCTCVLPIPSKNALMAIDVAIEMTPSIRHRVYASAMCCTSRTEIIDLTRTGRDSNPIAEKTAPAATQKTAAFASTAPAARRLPSA